MKRKLSFVVFGVDYNYSSVYNLCSSATVKLLLPYWLLYEAAISMAAELLGCYRTLQCKLA